VIGPSSSENKQGKLKINVLQQVILSIFLAQVNNPQGQFFGASRDIYSILLHFFKFPKKFRAKNVLPRDFPLKIFSYLGLPPPP
jgi:hypothetical protein